MYIRNGLCRAAGKAVASGRWQYQAPEDHGRKGSLFSYTLLDNLEYSIAVFLTISCCAGLFVNSQGRLYTLQVKTPGPRHFAAKTHVFKSQIKTKTVCEVPLSDPGAAHVHLEAARARIAEPGKQLALDMTTRNADPHVLFAVLDLYQTSQAKPYLALAERIGDNLVAKGFHGGYFMPHSDMQFANIDSIAPYALLALEAALQGKPTAVAPFINGAGFTEGAYRMADGRVRIATRDDELFALRHGEALLPNGKK